MISITLNGESKQVDDSSTVEALLKTLDLDEIRLAVEINLEIIPRSSYGSHRLNDLDKVEIVRAIGGG